MTEKEKLIAVIKMLKDFRKSSKSEQKKIIKELEKKVEEYE